MGLTRFTIVRFEDLLQHPEEELSRLLRFTGEEFEQRQLDPAVSTGTVPTWEKEWKGKAHEGIDRSRMEAWKNQASKKDLWKMNYIMGPMLRSYGYRDTELTGCPLWYRAYVAIYGRLSSIGVR